MMTKLYDLAYEVDGAGNVQLEQEAGFGEVSRIELHPIHVRLLAEQVGILAPSSNIEADRTIARLCRQMRILLQRIDQLDNWLNETAQQGHEDLTMETAYSLATWELATEFVTELPTLTGPVKGNVPEIGAVSAANTPESGVISATNNPKKGAVASSRNTRASAQADGQLPLKSGDERP
jgi:hypothetical protein